VIMDTKTITLKKPIEHGGQTYTTIELEEPTAGQLEKAGGHAATMTQQIVLISEVAKIPPDAVRKMRKSQQEEASAFLMGFTFVAPTTGDKSLQD